jgi:hypothetical protein
MSGTAINLADTGGRLSLSASVSSTLLTGYTATIAGLNRNGTGVDFSGLAFAGGEHAVVNGTTLSLLGTSGLLATLQVDPTPGYDLTVVNDGSGHPLVETAPCFLVGSRILTTHGEVAVEDLREGDVVVTASGRRRPICWIGHRRIDPARHPCPRTVQPIRIQRGAFAANLPHRELLLSPDHAVFVEGVLVPVRYLVNGTTIRHRTLRRRITYFHVGDWPWKAIWTRGVGGISITAALSFLSIRISARGRGRRGAMRPWLSQDPRSARRVATWRSAPRR